jgi:hypothetical protein
MGNLKFISINIYYNNHYRDCAAGGKSQFHESGYLLVEDGNLTRDDIGKTWIDWERVDKPIYKIDTILGSKYVREIHFDGTMKTNPEKLGPMFGGNFIYSSDSRFPSDAPIRIHDRYETPTKY